MLPDLTTDMKEILANQILSIEEVNGHLTRTVLVGDDEDHQCLILIFADGRWAYILPTRTSRGTGWSNEQILGVHIIGKYCEDHHCYGHYAALNTLYRAGLFTEEQWRAQLDLQQRRRAEQAVLDDLAAKQRQQDSLRAKEAAEERKRQQLNEEWYKTLCLYYDEESTDRGIKQMRTAQKRHQSQASAD